MPTPRPPSALERRLGVTPPVPLVKTATTGSGDVPSSDAGRDDTGAKTVDLSMFDPAKSNAPGQPPKVAPLKSLQDAQLQLSRMVTAINQKQTMMLQQVQMLTQQIQQLVQSGQVSPEQGQQMTQQAQQTYQQAQPPPLPTDRPPQAPPPPQEAAPEEGPYPEAQIQQPSPLPGEAAPPSVPDALDGTLGNPVPEDDGIVPLAPEGQRFKGPEENDLMSPAVARDGQRDRLKGPPTAQPYYQALEIAPPAHIETAIKQSAAVPHAPLHPTELKESLEQQYGPEVWGWEPETIVQTIAEDLKAAPDDEAQAIIFATQIILNQPELFWTNPQAFEATLIGLNGRHPDANEPVGSEYNHISPAELAFGVWCAQELYPVSSPGPEVITFTAKLLAMNGIGYAIAPLGWAQDALINECLHGDGQCLVNPTLVQNRFRQVANIPLEQAGLSDSDPIDQQVAKLMAIRDYINTHEEGV